MDHQEWINDKHNPRNGQNHKFQDIKKKQGNKWHQNKNSNQNFQGTEENNQNTHSREINKESNNFNQRGGQIHKNDQNKYTRSNQNTDIVQGYPNNQKKLGVQNTQVPQVTRSFNEMNMVKSNYKNSNFNNNKPRKTMVSEAQATHHPMDTNPIPPQYNQMTMPNQKSTNLNNYVNFNNVNPFNSYISIPPNYQGHQRLNSNFQQSVRNEGVFINQENIDQMPEGHHIQDSYINQMKQPQIYYDFENRDTNKVVQLGGMNQTPKVILGYDDKNKFPNSQIFNQQRKVRMPEMQFYQEPNSFNSQGFYPKMNDHQINHNFNQNYGFQGPSQYTKNGHQRQIPVGIPISKEKMTFNRNQIFVGPPMNSPEFYNNMPINGLLNFPYFEQNQRKQQNRAVYVANEAETKESMFLKSRKYSQNQVQNVGNEGRKIFCKNKYNVHTNESGPKDINLHKNSFSYSSIGNESFQRQQGINNRSGYFQENSKEIDDRIESNQTESSDSKIFELKINLPIGMRILEIRRNDFDEIEKLVRKFCLTYSLSEEFSPLIINLVNNSREFIEKLYNSTISEEMKEVISEAKAFFYEEALNSQIIKSEKSFGRKRSMSI